MKIRFKKESSLAKVPTRGTEGSAGYDFYATKVEILKIDREETGVEYLSPVSEPKPFYLVKYETGIAVEIPKGYVGLAFPRSSIAKKPLILANAVGVIDSDYRGPVNGFFRILDENPQSTEFYKVGDRVFQLVVVKHEDVDFEEVSDLSNTVRGAGGYGSTGA